MLIWLWLIWLASVEFGREKSSTWHVASNFLKTLKIYCLGNPRYYRIFNNDGCGVIPNSLDVQIASQFLFLGLHKHQLDTASGLAGASASSMAQ